MTIIACKMTLACDGYHGAVNPALRLHSRIANHGCPVSANKFRHRQCQVLADRKSFRSQVHMKIQDSCCQFEFGMRNRINAVERLASASKHFVFAQASDEWRSVGVTPIRHFELPPKLPRKCLAAPDPQRSSATIVCRPIRVRYTCFSGVLTRMPSLSDRYRSSPNIAN